MLLIVGVLLTMGYLDCREMDTIHFDFYKKNEMNRDLCMLRE
jgi:hypothetical protein